MPWRVLLDLYLWMITLDAVWGGVVRINGDRVQVANANKAHGQYKILAMELQRNGWEQISRMNDAWRFLNCRV